jgi:hypothetical protein
MPKIEELHSLFLVAGCLLVFDVQEYKFFLSKYGRGMAQISPHKLPPPLD